VPGFSYPVAATWCLAAGVLLVLLFSFHRDELKANVVSLAMTPLNVVSSMGDVISYVRLFAVGLASVQIARQFDEMAAGLSMPLWAKVPCMVLILLLGHALNLAMGALSILVHAVRLNTLEFSGAKGVTWSGVAFEPFRSKKAGA
jgi:V/A-type H+-transporting ATPase subunit I